VTASAGGRQLVRECGAGGSYLSQGDGEILIGLGAHDALESLSIRWPGGGTSQHDGLAVDQRHHIAFGGELISSEALPAGGANP
jgi:hypothetical protein